MTVSRPNTRRPNIVMIVADDHAPAAFSAYGSRLNHTPNLDRLAQEGVRLDRCFCTNALCTPARASILTGQYSHRTGVKTLDDTIDQTQQTTVAMLLHDAGYQSAFIGKWHLGHGGVSDPAGFDHWSVLPDQGRYFDPEMDVMGERRQFDGYVTDILTDQSLAWLEARRPDQPFFLVCAHKAPHGPFLPDPAHSELYADQEMPEPATFHDNYAQRAAAAAMSTQHIAGMHLKNRAFAQPPPGLSPAEQKRWNYQSFIKNYLRCVASIDDNVGRLLAYLDEKELAQDTIVLYTADHGFFLGDHGWFDKRFMYEQSIRIPLLMRYPAAIAAQSVCDEMVLNIDFAPTLLDYAGLPTPPEMQGQSIRPLLAQAADPPAVEWRTSFYYRYWMHLAHFNVPAHYGIRTERYKLIYYYGEALECQGAIGQSTPCEWELFDLALDPEEMHNVANDLSYADVVATLQHKLSALQAQLGDTPQHPMRG